MPARTEWWRITAPHYCAAIEVRNDFVIGSAPILRWARGKHLPWLLAYFASKGYTVEKLDVTDHEALG